MRHDLRRLFWVTLAILLVAASHYGYVVLFGGGVVAPRPEDTLSELGETVGGVSLGLLAALYGRTAIRLLLEAQAFRRFLQLGAVDGAGWLEKLRSILNSYHVHAGVAAIAATYVHAWLMTGYQTNLLLYAVLALAAWQGLFGAFLKLRHTPIPLKRKSYPAHAQLYTGVAILIFAVFGHLLYGGD